jgi:hypothetical protein
VSNLPPGPGPDRKGGVGPERVLNKRYRLGRLIAHGGMAEVWRATDDVLGRPVAVKVLHAHLSADGMFLERFRREAIAAARLAHPNVVATYDTGVDGGIAFIVMELVDGRTLRQVLVEQGPFEPRRAVHVAAQVAEALDYAHRAGIVHRDVKPANILLCDDGRVKVADFGIAKAVEDAGPGRNHPAEALTVTGSIIGTAQYLSPEQVEGRPVDGRADVYALGVAIYEMLVGRPPFSGDTELAVALQHVNATPPPPRQVRSTVPPALEAVVLRAMAKSPDDRYPSAGALQQALLSSDLAPGATTAVVGGDGPTSVALPRPDAAPQGAPPAGPRFRSPPPPLAPAGRRWLVPALVTAVVVVTLAVVGVIFVQSDTGRRVLDTSTGDTSPVTAQPISISRTQSFDPPPGSGTEHDSELPALVDGDPTTTWSTERYDGSLASLKPGVGVALVLDARHKLGQLKVTSPSRGWTAQAMVADGSRSTLQEWGAPVATKRGIGTGTTSFDLGGRTGSAVLLWITDLGDGNPSVSIGELQVTPS